MGVQAKAWCEIMQLKKLVVIALSLALIFVFAFSIRVLPLRDGIYMLNEHDPYYQYYMAKYVVERGWAGFLDWFSWGSDPRFWAPWGRNIASSSFPGVAFAGAFFYLLAEPFGLGLDLMTFCCLLPPLLGALSCIAVFFLGREVENESAGLFAALFLATNAAFISRTVFGFFDDESVGILALLISLIFYVKALKKQRLRDSMIYGVISGLALGYMSMTWGAYVYPLNLMSLFALIMVVMKRYSRSLLCATLPMLLVTLLVAASTPKNGLSSIFSATSVAPLLAVATLMVCELRDHLPVKARRPISIGYAMAVLAGLVVLLLGKGVDVSLRYLTAVLPWVRSTDPLVRSVAEHSMTTWSHFFMQFGFILLMGTACLFALARSLKDVDVLFILLGVSTVYVAANMVRLTLLLAPVFSLLAGIFSSKVITSTSKLINASGRAGERRVKATKRPLMPSRLQVFSGLFAILLILTPTVTGLYMVDPGSGLPVNLVYASSSILMSEDWLSALKWMRENLPANSVVASWWDHGYWIAIVGNRSSVCDNATINGTQIRLIARAFLSNESEALKAFKALGVTHVVVHGIFYNIGSALGSSIPLWVSWGHDYVAISYSAMASIAGYNVDDYIVLDNFGVSSFPYFPIPKGPKASETTLYRLIYYPVKDRLLFLGSLDLSSGAYSLLDIPLPQNFKLVYASEPNAHVLVYEVLYGDEG
ncbi:MAG: STT3 domain-containing protein [Candidatus Nezhaarchaeota archaeon]|nr:STT3 domain-containing protein [Candidatus Nezhaarchaeota archaeon]